MSGADSPSVNSLDQDSVAQEEEKNPKSSTVDFGQMLAQKFGSSKAGENSSSSDPSLSSKRPSCSGSQVLATLKGKRVSENFDSDNEVIESKVRGRHQLQDPNLRIKKLERILTSRKDLPETMRRKLQSRKNTAICRLKQKNVNQLAEFLRYELDEV